MNLIRSAAGALTALSVLLVPTMDTAQAAGPGRAWHCDNERVVSFWEGTITGKEASGRGTICATPWALMSSLYVEGLTQGNAYTVWWVYIDQPEACSNYPFTVANTGGAIPADEPHGYAGPCGLAEFFGDNPLGVFGRMDSVVAQRGRTFFNGEMRSFVPRSGSQVWMLVFGHGPADGDDLRHRARQLLTPEDPGTGAPHLGILDAADAKSRGYPAAVVAFDIP